VVATTNEIRFSGIAAVPQLSSAAAQGRTAAVSLAAPGPGPPVPALSGLAPSGSNPSGSNPAGPAPWADRQGPDARGHVEHLAYTARALGDRPEMATLYVPPGFDSTVRAGGRPPVVVFLHGIPGAPEDWLAGGGLAARLDDEIAAGRFPVALAVMPESATMHDPRAGWVDAPHQPVLRSLRTDLLPAVARRFPSVDLDPGRMAVVGVGRGADGAIRLAGLDRRFGYVVAIGPKHGSTGGRRAANVTVLGLPDDETPVRSHWAQWRADLPEALRALTAAGFGEPAPAPGARPSLARAGGQ
jgi:hypothetical protein